MDLLNHIDPQYKLLHMVTRDAKVSLQMSRPIVYKRKVVEA
jgi:hypothetical protein